MRLNIVFHNIVSDDNQLRNPYDLTFTSVWKLINSVSQIARDNTGRFSDVQFYFDDGYDSFRTFIFPHIPVNEYFLYCLAVITELIDTPGYVTSDIVQMYDKAGVAIASHGVSHAALAIYNSTNKVEKTPLGGLYRNRPRGKQYILSENEVRYQLKESKTYLNRLLKREVDEFVLPYGLYNNTVVRISKEYYKTITTCNKGLDAGSSLRTRVLVDNSYSLEELLTKIRRLQ